MTLTPVSASSTSTKLRARAIRCQRASVVATRLSIATDRPGAWMTISAPAASAT